MAKAKFPIYLVHGTLGAGKTSLIKHLSGTKYFERAFVIENEFASENIDGAELENHYGQKDIFEISGGCICCSSGGELLEILAKIARRKDIVPVIIETTGVADSAQLLKQLFLSDQFHANFYLAKNILILDTLELDPAALKTRRLDVLLADLIILNKIDLVQKSLVKKLMDKIKNITKTGTMLATREARVDLEDLTKEGSLAEHHLVENIESIAEAAALDHTSGLQYKIIPVEKATSNKKMLEYLDKLRLGPVKVKRLKGNYFDENNKVWHIEATEKHAETNPATARGSRLKLVLIGTNFPKNIFSFLQSRKG
jgi:G3E family GTPase